MTSGSSLSMTVCAKRFMEPTPLLMGSSIEMNCVCTKHFGFLFVACRAKNLVDSTPYLLIVPRQEANRPVAAIHHTVPAKHVDDMFNERDEIAGLPVFPIRFGYHSRQLAIDLWEPGDIGYFFAPI